VQKRGRFISRAGKIKGTKISLVTNEQGMPLEVQLAGAGVNDRYCLMGLVSKLPTHSIVVCDRGYDSEKLREELRRRTLKPVIPRRQMSPRKKRRMPSPVTYKGRWVNERTFAWMDWSKRLLVRLENYASRYKAFWQVACILRLLKNLPD
jgi:transposase